MNNQLTWKNAGETGAISINATNLNHMEGTIAGLVGNRLNLGYFYLKNTKYISKCEDGEVGWNSGWWLGQGGTVSYDTSTYKIGFASVKGHTTGASQGIRFVSNLDLSTFEDGSTSTDNDFIEFLMYIDGTSLANLDIFNVIVGVEPTETIYATTYARAILSYFHTLEAGWNYISIPKSGFDITNGGEPNFSWDIVTKIGFYTGGTQGGDVDFLIDGIRLTRKDPDSNVPNPLQYEYNGTFYNTVPEIVDGQYFLGLDADELSLVNFESTGGQGIRYDVNIGDSCIINYICFPRITNYTNKISYFVDINNYVTFGINNSNLELTYVVNGISNTVSKAVGTIPTYYYIHLTLIKEGSCFVGKCIFSGDENHGSNGLCCVADISDIGKAVLYLASVDTVKEFGVSTNSYSYYSERSAYAERARIVGYQALTFELIDSNKLYVYQQGINRGYTTLT